MSLSVEQRGLQALAKAMRAEADGKDLRKDLIRELGEAVGPIVEDARGAIAGMESGGLSHEGGGLRAAIAKQIKKQVRLGGRSTGVAVVAGRKGMPRGFEHAPKRTNRNTWRHPVFQREGRDPVYVEQVGKPRWFDDAGLRARPGARGKVQAALDKMAHRIAQRVRSGGG